jgi:DNA-binding MarR family transcriptional regulator
MDNQIDEGALHSLISLKLNVVQAKISRQVGQAVQKLADLRLPEWRILALVARGGPLSQADVRVRIGMDKGQISRTVKSMLKNGLLVADTSNGQSRNVLLDLSESGREKFDRVHTMMEARNEQMLSGLTREEQSTLYIFLSRIESVVDSLSSEPIDVAPGSPAEPTPHPYSGSGMLSGN